MTESRSWRTASWILDLLALAFTCLWLTGALRHGADPRRAALITIALGALLVPGYRERSIWLRSVHAVLKKFSLPRAQIIALVAWAVFCSVLGALQALALQFPLYDVGIFHQILWSLGHGHGFWSTISGAGDFLQDHLSPALAILAPMQLLSGDSPLFLPMIHPVLIATGIGAWLYLAWRLPGADQKTRSALATAALLFGCGFESIWGNLHWGFHENSISFATLSWAMALILAERIGRRSDRLRGAFALLLLILTAACKEILLLDVAIALFVLAWTLRISEASRESRHSTTRRLLLTTLGAGLITVFLVFEKAHHPADKNYFVRYYGYLGLSLEEFLRTSVLHPLQAVRNYSGQVGIGEFLRYLLTVFGPWLFLPFASGKGRVWLLVILPSLASAALSTYPPLRNARFHYVLELWPVLAPLTLIALAKIGSRKLVWAWAFLSLLAMDRDPLSDLREYWGESLRLAPIRALIQEIPPEESVSATELAGPWMASRLQVTRWPSLQLIGCPEWIVLSSPEVPKLEPGCEPSADPEWSREGWSAYRALLTGVK